MSDERENVEKVAHSLRGRDLPTRLQPGLTMCVTCCGKEVGQVRPNQWDGDMDFDLESLRPTVKGGRLLGLVGDTPILPTRRQRRLRWLNTTAGNAVPRPLGPDGSVRPVPELGRERADRWTVSFECRKNRRHNVTVRLERLIAIASDFADRGNTALPLSALK